MEPGAGASERMGQLRLEHLVLWQATVPALDVVYVSPNVADVLGRDPPGLRGPFDRFLEHLHPDDRAAVGAAAREIAPGEQRDVEARAVRPDGDQIVVRHTFFRTTNGPDGHGSMLIGVIADLSEPMAAAEELLAAQERTRAIVTTAVDGIVAIDERGIVESANPAALQLFGYDEEELIGRNVSMLMPSPYRDEHDRYVANYLRTGEARIIGIGREVEGLRKDGSTFPMDLAVGEAVVDGRRLFTGIIRDISQRKQAERALQEAEARMRAIVDTAVDGIIAINSSGIVQSLNPAAERIFGYGADDVIGRNVSMLMPAPYREEHDSYVRNYLATGVAKIIGLGREVEGLRRDGTTFPMDLAVGEAIVDGQRMFTGIVRDITERKRTEDALRDTQKLESLAVLAGGIAHDFNNLLVGILGNASLALEELPAASPVREQIQDVQLAARRAAELARQMLAYSGRGQFLVRPVDINQLVEEMGQLLRISIASQAVLRYNFATSLPQVEADATQLRQVMMNLVMNASDAIGDARGSITITTGIVNADRAYLEQTHLGREAVEGTYVFIEVSDTGSGMTAEVQARIFDPFFTTKFTGRGLGLAAVLGIVRAHGGAIRVYSEPGQGTTFKLLLPPAPGSIVERSAGESPEWLGTGVILVIDDEETSRQVAQRTLRSVGFDVLVAQDGRSGLQALEREADRVCLVILDLTMPGLSGTETYSQLRLRHKTVPVILMSGYTQEEATSSFAGKGIAGFIQKPYIPADLRSLVRQVLEAEENLG